MITSLFLKKSGKYPCAVCHSDVSNNSIKCSQWKLWVHKQFSGIISQLVADPNYVSHKCNGKSHCIDTWVNEVNVDGTMPDVEATFYYLGDMLWSSGGYMEGHSHQIRKAYMVEF